MPWYFPCFLKGHSDSERDSFRAILAKRVLEKPKVDEVEHYSRGISWKVYERRRTLAHACTHKDKNTGSVVKFQADSAFLLSVMIRTWKVLTAVISIWMRGLHYYAGRLRHVPGICCWGCCRPCVSAGHHQCRLWAMAALDAERWLGEHGISDVGDESSASKTEL